MKVWISSLFDNLPAEGFRRQRYWLMADAFAAAGHEVVYFTGDFNHGTKSRRVVGRFTSPMITLEMLPVSAYPANVCPARIKSHIGYALSLRAAARKLPAPDLVIAATPPLFAAMEAMKAARRHGAKFILDIQDAWPETFYRLLPGALKFSGKALFAPMHVLARKLYALADGVSGVSERYRGLCGRNGFYYAPHGIEVPSGGLPSSDRVSGNTRLVYAGNLGEGYDLETVVSAVATEEKLTLDIAGRGPAEKRIKDRIAREDLADRVRMHGYLHRDELSRLLRSCDVGIVPMRDDSWVGIPYKLCDYLAAGLRILSSLKGECGRLVESKKLGAVYEYGSPRSFLDKLSSVPAGPVILPAELSATSIYPQYVEWASGL